MKALLVILDGVGDIGEKTPLSEANIPTINRLASEGTTGLLHPLGRGSVPTSGNAHLSIFGYDLSYYPGRGPIEALGAGVPLRPGDVAFRCNFATVRDGKIIDRRAGRIDKGAGELAASLNGTEIDGTEIILHHTSQHRLVMVFRGEGLSPNITPTDPHEPGGSIPKSKPLDDTTEAKKTAHTLNKLTRLSMGLADHPVNKARKLPANIILARGPGQMRKVPSLKQRFNISAACVAGGALYKGVAKYVGMDIIDVPGATATFNTDLMSKAKSTLETIKTHDLVFLHIKATDNSGHDGNFGKKQEMVEKVDRMLKIVLPSLPPTNIVLTGDHSTPVSLKRHSSDPVPILFWGPNITPDSVQKFNEFSCQEGGLGHLEGLDIMPRIQDFLGKSKI